MSNTEIPHAEDFIQELAMLIETYQKRGLSDDVIIASMVSASLELSNSDEDEE